MARAWKCSICKNWTFGAEWCGLCYSRRWDIIEIDRVEKLMDRRMDRMGKERKRCVACDTPLGPNDERDECRLCWQARQPNFGGPTGDILKGYRGQVAETDIDMEDQQP